MLDWPTWLHVRPLLGSVTLWTVHQRRVATREPGWAYSMVTLLSLAFVTIMGVVQGSKRARR